MIACSRNPATPVTRRQRTRLSPEAALVCDARRRARRCPGQGRIAGHRRQPLHEGLDAAGALAGLLQRPQRPRRPSPRGRRRWPRSFSISAVRLPASRTSTAALCSFEQPGRRRHGCATSARAATALPARAGSIGRMAALRHQRAADEGDGGEPVPQRHLAHGVGEIDRGGRPRHLALRAPGHRLAGLGDERRPPRRRARRWRGARISLIWPSNSRALRNAVRTISSSPGMGRGGEHGLRVGQAAARRLRAWRPRARPSRPRP